MLLNKLIVVDKGFVALLDTSNNGRLLKDIQDEYFLTKFNIRLLEFSTATLVIKCPLFVQINLSQCGLTVVSTTSKEIEAYIPDMSEISGNSIDDRNEMHEYIKITTEALILNQKGLPMDGADAFTSQLLTPISIYSEILVNGSIRQWINFLNQNLPNQVSTYQVQVLNVIKSEWTNIEELKKMLK